MGEKRTKPLRLQILDATEKKEVDTLKRSTVFWES